jgi:hypothetical protein
LYRFQYEGLGARLFEVIANSSESFSIFDDGALVEFSDIPKSDQSEIRNEINEYFNFMEEASFSWKVDDSSQELMIKEMNAERGIK